VKRGKAQARRPFYRSPCVNLAVPFVRREKVRNSLREVCESQKFTITLRLMLAFGLFVAVVVVGKNPATRAQGPEVTEQITPRKGGFPGPPAKGLHTGSWGPGIVTEPVS